MTIDAPITPSNSDSMIPTLHGVIEHRPTIPSPMVLRKVLIVEHDAALRSLIADVFDFEGYCVVEIDSEAELAYTMQKIRLPTHSSFDLLVMGFQSQGEFNLDTLLRLRKLGCNTPAIALADEIDTAIDQRMHELDVAVLRKPFTLVNLRTVANHVLHRRPGRLATLD